MKISFKQYAKMNVYDLRQELARAHVIIAALAVATMLLLYFGATLEIQLDQPLSILAGVLSGLVGVLSLGVAFLIVLSEKKKK